MHEGYLSKYYLSVAAKRLSSVEIDPNVSNQHEFNGSKELKKVFGLDQPQHINAKFIWLGEEEISSFENGTLTWYDSREKHPTRSEYRLYFKNNTVTAKAKEGDTLFVAKRTDGTLQIIITETQTTIERQLFWLFGLSNVSDESFVFADVEESGGWEIGFITKQILDELGNEVVDPEPDLIDSLILPFKGEFPSTSTFSDFARNTLPENIDALADPDGALLKFMDWEERLFRRLEYWNVKERLEKGFRRDHDVDVDAFIEFSLSVQNRRKSRAGFAFEYHLASVFNFHGVKFAQRVKTELNSKPDFLFPGRREYFDASYPNSKLAMLGAKTTCKDRWRQVLSEAKRIDKKHLITLEPGISEDQTNEMIGNNVQLVIPAKIFGSYTPTQQTQLIHFNDFIKTVKTMQ